MINPAIWRNGSTRSHVDLVDVLLAVFHPIEEEPYYLDRSASSEIDLQLRSTALVLDTGLPNGDLPEVRTAGLYAGDSIWVMFSMRVTSGSAR